MNTDDARRVFSAYDDKKGTIPATIIKEIMIDMGYEIANNPNMNNYFKKVSKSAEVMDLINVDRKSVV